MTGKRGSKMKPIQSNEMLDIISKFENLTCKAQYLAKESQILEKELYDIQVRLYQFIQESEKQN